MAIYLKELTINDDDKIYNMLQTIDQNENEFKNPVKGMTYKEFKYWLIEQNNWSRGINLPDGYVTQSIYWLYDNENPVGIGKIRHELTEHSRNSGGNIGYAISSKHRGKGYGKQLISLLIKKCDEIGVSDRLLTVEKYNPISKRVIEQSGGKLIKEDREKWYFNI